MKLKQSRVNKINKTNEVVTLSRLDPDKHKVLIKTYESLTGVSYAKSRAGLDELKKSLKEVKEYDDAFINSKYSKLD